MIAPIQIKCVFLLRSLHRPGRARAWCTVSTVSVCVRARARVSVSVCRLEEKREPSFFLSCCKCHRHFHLCVTSHLKPVRKKTPDHASTTIPQVSKYSDLYFPSIFLKLISSSSTISLAPKTVEYIDLLPCS